jgi:hypothetical protein
VPGLLVLLLVVVVPALLLLLLQLLLVVAMTLAGQLKAAASLAQLPIHLCHCRLVNARGSQQWRQSLSLITRL